MSILDRVERPEPSVANGANRLRQQMSGMVSQMTSSLQNVRRIVDKFGRAELAAELGEDDAAELLTIYNAVKAVVNDVSDEAVADLPS